ncbi:hypothetical protein N8Z24_00450 [bacterium]|nr:hypothetical protein [bacterium]
MTHYANRPVLFAGKSMVTATLGANDPEPGYRMTDGDEDYVFVYNAGVQDIEPSYGCIMSAVSGYSVTLSSTTSVDFLVGVCKHATVAAGSYGWLVTRGFCQVEMGANNSVAAGGLVQLGDDGTFGDHLISTGNVGNAVGKAMGAAASAASATAFINVY